MSQIQVELQDWMGDDRAIAESAWTSSLTQDGKETRTGDDVTRIVRMLASSGHAVPFESVVLRFWIRLPIFADRQHMTHRIASQNGMSGRYRTMPNDFFAMPKDVEDIYTKCGFAANHDILCKDLHEEYALDIRELKVARDAGKITEFEFKRAREFIRGELPQSSMTERVTTINLRSWSNYIRLRLSEHAQPEIRTIAAQMYKQIRDANICPTALTAIAEQGWLLDKPNHEWMKYVD